MLISESWLRQWVSPKLDTAHLAEGLTLAGLEVNSITSLALSTQADKLLVGEIVAVTPHPDADRLQVCRVDVGTKNLRSIVCGATNAKPGCKVPVALVGAKLAQMTIKKTTVRGVSSNGMLCSAAELGLEEQSSGLLILDQSTTVGDPIEQVLGLDDQVIELDLTPNRGDCLSISGVAREVAAFTGAELKTPTISKVRSSNKTKLSISLDAPAACPCYIGRAVCGIDLQARTPDWMREKLRRGGIRSISAVVDVTNYVMLELGQPMHAFDLAKIDQQIIVRRAHKGETITLLDGTEQTLDSSMLVIADRSKSIALAGIMGGENSAISESTRDIYLESALFMPHAIIGKARQLGMQTDASHHFERGVDPQLQLIAMDRAVELLLAIAGGEAGPVSHQQQRKHFPKRAEIVLGWDEIERKLGIKPTSKRVAADLKRLGMTLHSIKGGWRVTPPSWRFDIEGEHDLIEEVARLYGYQNIPAAMPTYSARTDISREQQITTARIRQTMMARGYCEAITYSFVDAKLQDALLGHGSDIVLNNPIADNMSVMRRSLWPGLIEALRTNLYRQNERVRLFETGHTFKRKGRNNIEVNRIAAAITGACLPLQWDSAGREVDFYDLKGDLINLLNLTGKAENFSLVAATHPALHPGQAARLETDAKPVGWIGRLHPQHQQQIGIEQAIYLLELDLHILQQSILPQFTPISRFPAVQRDLAIVVDQSVTVESVERVMLLSAGQQLINLNLFDVYCGSGIKNNQKSLAFNLTFQSDSSNLTAQQVELLTDKIIYDLAQQHNARLRT